jgi:hypothetical protein
LEAQVEAIKNRAQLLQRSVVQASSTSSADMF